MKDKTIKIDLSKIANTALQEKVDKELEKVLDNILDLNTEAKATRKVTITLTMSTDDERTVVKNRYGSQIHPSTAEGCRNNCNCRS